MSNSTTRATRAIPLYKAGTPLIHPEAATVMKFQRRLEASQWHGADELLERQLTHLGDLLRYARAQVPFYRDHPALADLPATGGITMEQWRRIPILPRAKIQETPNAFHAAAIPPSHGKTAEILTSGSTGTPLAVLGTRVTGAMHKALSLRAYLWHRHHFKGTLAIIRWVAKGQADYPGLTSSRWSRVGSVPFVTGPSRTLDCMIPIPIQTDWLEEVNPDYLLTFPSNLSGLAAEVRRRGVTLPNLKAIRTLGEVVTDELRAEVREVFGIDLQDVYSSQEMGIIAIQCPDEPVYHIQSESVFVEVVDEEGNPVGPGETGRIVITHLHNLAMPMLRYEQGDYATLGAPCACGRGLPVLTRVLGRHRNLFFTPDGERFWPGIGARHFPEVAPVRQYRVIQTRLDQIVVEMKVARPLSDEEDAAVRAIIDRFLPAKFDIVFKFVDEIPRTKQGKFEEYICRVGEGEIRRPGESH